MDLCTEIVKAMRSIGISESTISSLTNTEQFMFATDKPDGVQKALISSGLFRLMLRFDEVPNNVRLSLNMPSSPSGWFDDVRLVVLPYIKIKESEVYA